MNTQENTRVNVDVGKDKKRLNAAAKKFGGVSATSMARMLILKGLDDIDANKLKYNPEAIVEQERQ